MWGNGVEELGSGGEAEVEDVAEELTAELEAGGDIVRAVEFRIHDEPLPADRGAGFLEVDAHDNHHPVGHLSGERG